MGASQAGTTAGHHVRRDDATRVASLSATTQGAAIITRGDPRHLWQESDRCLSCCDHQSTLLRITINDNSKKRLLTQTSVWMCKMNFSQHCYEQRDVGNKADDLITQYAGTER